jgi:hypothetical protein
MSNTKSITIFHLYRKDGTSLLLHPLKKKHNVIKLIEKNKITGKYGSEPQIETLTLFRNELYRLIEEEVKNWIADVRFIPRFLISSGAFLLTYLIFSFVVRDPLPLLDEIIIAFGVGVVSYILLGKKDMRSDAALKKRLNLRKKVDTIVFNECSVLRDVEKMLQENEQQDTDELLSRITNPEAITIPESNQETIKELLSYIQDHLRTGKSGKQSKSMVKLIEDRKGKKQDKDVDKKTLKSKCGDLSLFALYKQLRISLEE